ncbi:MAG: hypothetical protein LUM44_00065 [Pyrinomonadaceae bacterium]|nr:hypothetical protein [Pyrinomonadaceae bacterium]
MKLIEILLALFCIFAAIYNFDLYDFNRCIVSILLLLTAVLTLSQNEKIKSFARNFAVALTIFLIMKILITG